MASSTASAKREFVWGEEVPSGTRSLDELHANIYRGEGDAEFEGPLKSTHWLLPGLVMCGSSAGTMSSNDLQVMVRSGVNIFVNLQSSYTEYGCNDYRKTLRALRKDNPEDFYESQPIRFLHIPVEDFETMSDNTMLSLIKLLCEIIAAKTSIVYIHCYGGHGRTGSVATNLLAATQGMSVDAALKFLREAHFGRRLCSTYRYCSLSSGRLESKEQEQQARKLNAALQQLAPPHKNQEL